MGEFQMKPIEINTVYVVKGNEDTTEGRGGMVDRAVLDNPADAYAAATSGQYGVMGSKNSCDIYERRFITINDEKFTAPDRHVYDGYKKKWTDNVDLRYKDDPEFEEYLRLKEKFSNA